MAAPTLIIGVGGTGIRVLLRVKERLLEAYDEVPSNITLFEIDTDDYRDNRISFNGVTLTVANDPDSDKLVGPDTAEFYWVHTENVEDTLDNVFARYANGDREWQWINKNALDRTLTTPEDRVISAGARTVRPVGRSALFIDYGTVYQHLHRRLRQVVHRHQAVAALDDVEPIELGNIRDDRKATVFVVASVAGGSGAGMVIDILRMIEHMRVTTDLRAKPIAVMPLLVGGACFSENGGARTDSNTYAALREIDRLAAVAGLSLNKAVPPVMWAPEPVGRFSSSLGPADMILLFDRPDRLQREKDAPQDIENSYLEMVVAPSLADIIMAFADEKIAPAMRTVRADMGETFSKQDPFNANAQGHYPYASAGIHTLIFPERDIRRSAGYRLLLEVWKKFVVRVDPEPMPPASAELWGESLPSAELTPQVFTDEGFVRPSGFKDAPNNPFLMTVVYSSKLNSIRLPRQGFIFRKSTIARVLELVGLPSNRVEVLAEQLESRIKQSIEQLDNTQSAEEIREWRRNYLGEGQLGHESHGAWMSWISADSSVSGHKGDFLDTLRTVATAVLNDTDPQGQILAFRLEYMIQVLDRLEHHVQRWSLGNPDDPAQGHSLLERDFTKQMGNELKARNKVRALETQANQKFTSYLKANKNYAEQKKELVGKYLLEMLCNDLHQAIVEVRDALVKIQEYLLGIYQVLATQQTQHEENRLRKDAIPVRTYLTKRPANGYFKDGEFENGLYQNHKASAIEIFRKSISWSWNGRSLELSAPFGKDPSQEMKTDEVARRAINWAGTIRGNLDRSKVETPLRNLASQNEVQMAVRIRDYFGRAGEQALSNTLTNARLLASLCPLRNWPTSRLMYYLALPTSAPEEDDVGPFYQSVVSKVRSNTAPPQYHARRNIEDSPANPRHAVATEFAVGFRLEHRTDLKRYEDTYRNDTNRYFALHCLPEEDIASTKYEIHFHRTDALYQELALDPLTLHPAVVDVLGDSERLDLFVTGLVIGSIALLPREERATHGVDFYLWPAEIAGQRIRLSKMNLPDEIDTIARTLAPTLQLIPQIVANDRLMNQLRLMYALRTFVLLERDIDNAAHRISYPTVATEFRKQLDVYEINKRVDAYSSWRASFLGYYTEHKEQYPILAHLGLVLARAADRLRNSEAQKQL